MVVGIDLTSPRYSAGASGLRSQVSWCAGPPHMNRTMHDFALPSGLSPFVASRARSSSGSPSPTRGRAPARRTSRRVGVRGIRSQLPARQFHRHYASPTVGAATGRPRKPARSANDSRFVLLLPMSGCLRVRRLSNNLCGQPNSESGVTMCSRLPLSCTLAILIVDPTLADDKPSPLADADKKELTELLKDVL